MVDFKILYRKYMRQHWSKFSAERLQQNVVLEGFTSANVKEYTCHSFVNFDGFLLEIDGCKGFFPKKRVDALAEDNGLVKFREVLATADFVIPPMMSLGFIEEMASEIEESKQIEITSLEFGRRMYQVDNISAIFTEVYKKNQFIGRYYNLLEESLKAFYLGLYSVAVVAMFPVLEGSIRDIGDKMGIRCSEKVDIQTFVDIIKKIERRIIDLNVFQGLWVPCDFKSAKVHDRNNEQIQMLENLIYFLRDRLYKNSKEYNRQNNLNRHGIVHGFFDGYNSEVNYYRMITIMNMVYVCSVLISQGSLFHPSATEESKELEKYLAKINVIKTFI
jgi:hypothetical protein